ncbi:MAG: hypothetical protein OMM_04785 [Candidatus Magnetoglobus multicellularis str. Araruama]|uniref:Cadherin domain-containing protein n=1 Tax=Candidatus Magnetoglobus multicellularis str. Araruama TaxID=890399 RepID=A0A1V1NZR7_9BACT|nr:MAG: hypothetical protein OMM_04785 [Candidatus Magnetoglobus multicellularis str. Araruama]
MENGRLECINSVFSGNAAGNGGLQNKGDEGYGVRGEDGTGGGVRGGSGALTNCTIVSNTPYGIDNFDATIVNSIIYFNTLAQIEGELTITSSNIQNSYTGNHNIEEDPLFVDYINGDFHLSDMSPCIDAGTSILDSNNFLLDKDGNKRLGNVDMGAYENVTLNHNYTPVFLGPDTFDFYENSSPGTPVGQFSVVDSESDSCTITIIDSSNTDGFSLTTGPQTGNQYTITIIANEETNYEAMEQYTLCILADDGYNTSRKTVFINIVNVPEAPEITTSSNWITDENQPLTMNILIGDPDGDPLTLEIESSTIDIVSNDHISISGQSNRFASISLINFGKTLPVTITPKDSTHGKAFLLITVIDKDGMSDAMRITLTVLPNSDNAPVAENDNVTVDEDQHLYIKLNASDLDNDILSFHLVTPPAHGTVSQTEDLILYTPGPNYNGPDSFSFKANDGQCDSNIATIMITVYPVDDIPQSTDQYVTTTENMPVDITLTGFSPDGKEISFQIKDLPAHGILSQSESYLTYTPDHHYYGTDKFTFMSNDSISNSIPATVSITVERSSTYVLKLLGTGYGTVNINSKTVLLPWEDLFQADQNICFEAIPDTDWRFVNWHGDLQSTDNPVCILLDQNKTITANMEIKTFALSIQGSEAITINNALYTLPFNKIFEIHTPITIESASELFNCWEGDQHSFNNPYTFTINSNTSISANFYPVPDWQTSIQIERSLDNNDIQQQQASVLIGTASQAYTKIADVLPEEYSCDIVLNNQAFERLLKDIQANDRQEFQWIVSVNPRGNIGNEFISTTAKLSWDPLTFSSEGKYMLKTYTGETLISDMRQTTEYQVTDNSYTLLSIIWQKLEIFEFHLSKGWNLISLPLTPSNIDISQLFPDYEAAYEYKSGAYYPVTSFAPGKGYWLKIPSQKIYEIAGQPFQSYSIDLSDGWHLIGAAFDEMTPDDMSIKVIFRYVNGGYEQAFTLMPGFGYWIKIEE